MTAISALGPLPEWNLGDLYASSDAGAFGQDMQKGETRAKLFSEIYNGKLALLPCDELAAAIKEYESTSDLLVRTGAYAQLYYFGDTTDAARGRV